MKNTCLSIQGPPGTGKTYNSAKIIIELMNIEEFLQVVMQI